MKIVAIIQARMGSTRLPGKVMKVLEDHTVLGHVILRLKEVPSINEIVVATTTKKEDLLIVEEASKYGVGYHRGSEEDVLSRFYEAAVNFNADVIVRVTSDCPLIDPQLIENVIDCYSQSTSEYARLDLGCFPRGLDVEVLSFDALERSHLQAANHEHREHVTLFVYQNEAIFGKVSYSIEEDYSKYRFTLDTIEDWQLISSIFEHLYRPEYAICYKDIIHLLEQYPELAEINANIEQKHQTR